MAQWWGACLAPQKEVESIRELRIPNYISIQSLYNLQNSREKARLYSRWQQHYLK